MALKRFCAPFVLVLVVLSALPAIAQSPLGTGFSYQGRLEQSGVAVNSAADFEFRLFDASVTGAQIGAMLPRFDVPVVDGLFTVVLDFGAGALDGDARWLEIAVRSLESDPFTVLNPRQALAGAPYAVQTRGIFVNVDRQVGIGTTSPDSKLHVQTQVNADLIHAHGPAGNNTNYEMRKIGAISPTNVSFALSHRSNGTEGWMYGYDGTTFRNFQGWDFASNQVRFPATGNTLALDLSSGRVGLGTSAPAARLDVRGDVKLGPTGQYFASSSGENLRIVRGTVDDDGTILEGSGFSVLRQSPGDYRIAFSTPFGGAPPSVTATVDDESDSISADFYVAGIYAAAPSSVAIRVRFAAGIGNPALPDASGPTDQRFHFIAIGPR